MEPVIKSPYSTAYCTECGDPIFQGDDMGYNDYDDVVCATCLNPAQ